MFTSVIRDSLFFWFVNRARDPLYDLLQCFYLGVRSLKDLRTMHFNAVLRKAINKKE